MRLQSLATSDWHFDGNYKNLTLIGPTMISASLLCLFTFPELLFVQKQEKSDLRLLCEQGLMMCKDYKIRQAFYQLSCSWKFRMLKKFCWQNWKSWWCSVSVVVWFLPHSQTCLQQRTADLQHLLSSYSLRIYRLGAFMGQ